MFIDITNWRGAAPIAVPSTPNPPSLPSPSWERNANIFFCGWGYKVLKAFTSLTNYFDVTWFNCFKLCGFVWVQSIFFTNRTGDKVWNRVRFVSSKFSLDVESKNLIFHSQYLMNTKLGWSLGHIFFINENKFNGWTQHFVIFTSERTKCIYIMIILHVCIKLIFNETVETIKNMYISYRH